MTHTSLILAGAGGFGREVAAFIRARNMKFEVIGFIDDEKAGEDIIGPIRDHSAKAYEFARYVTSIGEGRSRAIVRKNLEAQGAVFTNLKFPDVLSACSLEEGTNNIFLGACSISCNVAIGSDVLVQGMAVIGHDVTIGFGVTVSSHAFVGGWATLGDFCTLHPHSVVLPHVKIGEGAVVGAGSVVIKDVEPYTTVFGSPAKVIYRNAPSA